MSKKTLRVVDDNVTFLERYSEIGQLSLFDFKPVNRIFCLPMSDIHGATFSRLLCRIRPRMIVDLRKYPFFDLMSMDRPRVLDIIKKMSSLYLHTPLDLKKPSSLEDRWDMRHNAHVILCNLSQHLVAGDNVLVFLLHSETEIDVLGHAVRGQNVDGLTDWTVEALGLLSRAEGDSAEGK